MGKAIAVIGGIISMAGGIALVIFSATFRFAFVKLVEGFIPPILFFGGLIGLIAGISSIKDAQRTKKLELESEEKPTEP
jgi:Na+/H+-dicarboxylate symporter